VVPGNDGPDDLARTSLLEAIITMGDFCQSLLCYYYSNIVVPMGKMPIATVTYGLLLLQWYDVVVVVYPNKKIDRGCKTIL
jgi:hypothetical protein